MKNTILALAIGLMTVSASAMEHSGFCNSTESCVVVATDYKKAQEICNLYLQSVLKVVQAQADGSVKFVGYVCVSQNGAF